MKLVDLTRLLDPDEEVHPSVRSTRVVLPKITYYAPQGEGVRIVCEAFGCAPHHLPNGEGWGTEDVQLATHTGTHVDAPLHYGSTCEGKPARTISDIPVEELFVDAIVLDLRGTTGPGEAITVATLKKSLKAAGAAVTPGSAILLRTGQEAYKLSQPEYFRYPGMTREGTLFLANLGAKLLGTDALGWDRPIKMMAEVFKKSQDPADIWDGHYAGRDKEVFIVQQLVNLAALPPSGFKVAFFPIKLARCSAAPARVVAFVP
jgi:kynurenine formamidase